MANNLFSVELEKLLISYIIKDYTILSEIPRINEKDFTPNTNRVVFQAIQSCLVYDKKGFSKFLLAEKLNGLNIKIAGEIAPSQYIEALDLLGRDITREAAIGVAKKLKNITVRRVLNEAGQRIVDLTKNDDGKKVTDLINDVTQIFNKEVNIIDNDDSEPKDIYAEMQKVLDNFDNAGNSGGIEPPFPLYQKAFGNFDAGDVTAIVARPKNGKSTIMLSIMNDLGARYTKDEFACLIIDTELELKRNCWRAASQMTGVAEYFFKNGAWKDNEIMSNKVKETMKIVPGLEGKIYHQFCAGKTLEEQVSIAKRWYAKHVAYTNKKCIIVVDYIKLGSADLMNAKNANMFLEVGLKIDRWKTVASELGVHLITACQSNKLGEGDDGVSDGTIVSLSDMISQFSSTILHLKRLSINKKVMLGNLDATHGLHCIYTRNLGEDVNFLSEVKYTVTEHGKPKDIWSPNFLLYKFDNFKVTEVSDFKTWAQSNRIVNVNISDSKIAKPAPTF